MKPLSSITVLDFSRVLAAPMATQILAELGAEVIKIERPGSGDETRSWEPRFAQGESGYYFAFNRGKRSVTLNLKSAEGQKIARDLAAGADIVVENFLVGEMEGFGLGYEALSTVNPGLIYVSTSGFGHTGPYRDRKGYDTVFQALSGVMSLTGHPDGPPAKVGLPFADLTSGLYVAIAALSGLAGRADRGKGCHVDMSMLDVQVSLLTIAAARWFAYGEVPERTGTQHPGRVPSAAFECADGGWVHITVSDQHWQSMCKVLGLDHLADDAALSSNAGRIEQRDRVMDAMTAAIRGRAQKEMADALRAAGVPAGEVNTVAQILEDPHIAARGVVGHFDHAAAGRVPALCTPLRFNSGTYPAPGTPPTLGADTDAVLAEKLGLDAAEIERMRKDRVI